MRSRLTSHAPNVVLIEGLAADQPSRRRADFGRGYSSCKSSIQKIHEPRGIAQRARPHCLRGRAQASNSTSTMPQIVSSVLPTA